MARTPDLTPPIDSSVEQELMTFDFGPILATSETITTISSVSCDVFEGSDTHAFDRLLASPVVAASPTTGAAAAAVVQSIGNMIGGTTYRLQCLVTTSLGQKLSLWTHLACQTPA